MNLNDRMKKYEEVETNRKFLPNLPILARLDGRCFHSFTSGLNRPYDNRLSDLMVNVTNFLVSESNACIGYTQSDEITLLFYTESDKSQIFFDSKIFKLTSILASMATARFNYLLADYIPENSKSMPTFDCRVWSVPSKIEAVNVFLWREQDATRNSVSMAAHHYYSPKELKGKKTSDMHEMLYKKRINWNKYPIYFKRGVYVQRRKIKRKFYPEEIDKLPIKHNARINPNLEVARTEIQRITIPPLATIKNKIGVIFNGEDPILKE